MASNVSHCEAGMAYEASLRRLKPGSQKPVKATVGGQRSLAAHVRTHGTRTSVRNDELVQRTSATLLRNEKQKKCFKINTKREHQTRLTNFKDLEKIGKIRL